MSERPTCELCGHPMPDGEEMFKFHGYSGPCPGPRTRPMGGVPEVIELHGEKWVRIDVVRKQEERLAAAEAEAGRCHGIVANAEAAVYAAEQRLAAAETALNGTPRTADGLPITDGTQLFRYVGDDLVTITVKLCYVVPDDDNGLCAGATTWNLNEWYSSDEAAKAGGRDE